MSGKYADAKSSGDPNRTSPATSGTRNRASIASACATIAFACGNSRSPSAVNRTTRVVRCSTRHPSIASSFTICPDTADCDRPIRPPVALKLPVSASDTNVRNRLVSRSFMRHANQSYQKFPFLFSIKAPQKGKPYP